MDQMKKQMRRANVFIMSLNAKMDNGVYQLIGRDVMVRLTVMMDQTKKIVKTTHVLRMLSNVRMENSVSGLVRDVMVCKEDAQMDQMKKIVKITHVLQISSNAEMDNVSNVVGGVMVGNQIVLMVQMKKIVCL